MTSVARRICIVTPGYISATPRVVREADALAGAGYDVRVAFTQGQLERLRRFDDDLLRRKPWRASAFGWSNHSSRERWAYHRTRLRHHIARALPVRSWAIAGVIERAEGRVYPELAALAAAEPADLYIGHYPDGLAAAFSAAARCGAAVGYDVEDLYADSFALTPRTEKTRARILELERKYVPRCAYVSAVSAPVADVFAARYDRDMPLVVHNCHPWSDRSGLDGRRLQRRGDALSLYWFSQTVGLDRGIQDAIHAAGLLMSPVQIHLQGAADAAVERELRALAARSGAQVSLHFHGPVPPRELLSRASEHDIGLALEPEDVLNHRLTVSNKQFLYLLAGLAIAASDVPGQRTIMETCPTAGVCYQSGDFRRLASYLDVWSREPSRLAAARAAALESARTRWSWELESRRLIDLVETVLPSGGRSRLAG